MEAKSIGRIAEELGVNFYDLHPLISARDDFHFKAGRDSFLDDVGNAVIPLSEAYEKGHRAGIKEVVEWLNNHLINLDNSSYPDKVISSADYQRFQAKLKEWGIEC